MSYEESGGKVHQLTVPEFEEKVLERAGPVLVAFSAEWCAPCRWLFPYLYELASAGRLVFTMDAEEATELLDRFRVTSLPTVICFESGHEIDRSLGIEPDRLRRMAGMAAGGE